MRTIAANGSRTLASPPYTTSRPESSIYTSAIIDGDERLLHDILLREWAERTLIVENSWQWRCWEGYDTMLFGGVGIGTDPSLDDAFAPHQSLTRYATTVI